MHSLSPDLNYEKTVLSMIVLFICIDPLKLLDCISKFEGKSTVQLPTRYVQLKLYPPCLSLLNIMFASLTIIAIPVVLGRCLILHHNYYVYSRNKPKIVQVLSMHCLDFDLCYCCITATYQYLLKCRCCWPFFLVFAFCLPPVHDSFPQRQYGKAAEHAV